MKPIKNARRVTRFSDEAAIRLHTEANKSDPFASRRMALTLTKRTDRGQDVGEESLRIINARTQTDGAMADAMCAWVDAFGMPKARSRRIAA